MKITKKYLQKLISEELTAVLAENLSRKDILKALANGEIAKNEEEFDQVWEKVFCPDPNDQANCSNTAYGRGETEYGPTPHAEYLAKWKSKQSPMGMLGAMGDAIGRDDAKRLGYYVDRSGIIQPAAKKIDPRRKLFGLKEQAYQAPVDQFDEYPPRPDPSHAPSVRAYQQKEVDKLLSAIEDGLVAKGIRLREELKVSNIRRYKGSGTGYTVEIEVAAFGED